MVDIFSHSSELRSAALKPVKRKKRSRVSDRGVVLRRDGKVIKDSVKRVGITYPEVKVRKARLDRENWDWYSEESNYYNWFDPAVRRRLLGKYLYERREELVRVLMLGYSVHISYLETESYNTLVETLDMFRASQAKCLEVHDNHGRDDSERLGQFHGSFKTVSRVGGDYCSTVEEEVDETMQVGGGTTFITITQTVRWRK